MTIFKNRNDGKLYSIILTEKDGIKKYTAIPFNHSSKPISDCDIKDFSIHSINGGTKNGSFL
jgi:hypothetical protein